MSPVRLNEPCAPLSEANTPPAWRAIGDVFRTLLLRWWLLLLIREGRAQAQTSKPRLRPPKTPGR